MWNNNFENSPSLQGFEAEDGYNNAAERLQSKLYELLDIPYTDDETPAIDDEVDCRVLVRKETARSPYDLIKVRFLTKPREFEGAPFIKMEMRKILRTYDRVDEVTFHFVEDHYILMGASYNVTPDSQSYFPLLSSHLQQEIPEGYILHLENLVENYFKPAEHESAEF